MKVQRLEGPLGGIEGRRDLPEVTIEIGHKERKAGGAVEEVTEGEVEDEDGGGASEPWVVLSIP